MAVENGGDSAVLRREIRIDASPATVFRFLVEPERIVSWMGTEAVLEPHPGGAYRVNVTGHEHVRGEVVEVVPDRRLVFTWGWEEGPFPLPPGASTVEITLEPDGAGTLLRLAHRGLTRELRDLHAIGWEHFLDRLGLAASGHDLGRDAFTSPVRLTLFGVKRLPRRYGRYLYLAPRARIAGWVRSRRRRSPR